MRRLSLASRACWSSYPQVRPPIPPSTPGCRNSRTYAAKATKQSQQSTHTTSEDWFTHAPCTSTAPGTSESTNDPTSTLVFVCESPTPDFEALTALPTDHSYSAESLLSMLKLHLPPPVIIHAIKLISSSLPTIDPATSVKVLDKLARQVCSQHLLALLPTLSSLFIQRVDQALADETEMNIQTIYWRYLKALNVYSRWPVGSPSSEGRDTSHKQPLAHACRKEFAVIARHLFRTLESLPSSSSTRLTRINENLVQLFCARRIFSLDLGSEIEKYAERSETPLPDRFYMQMFKVAIEANRPKQAMRALEFSQSVFQDAHPIQSTHKDRLTIYTSHAGGTFAEFSRVIQEYLKQNSDAHDEESVDMQRYAWHLLISRASQQEAASVTDILELLSLVPRHAIGSLVLSTVMKALAEHEDFHAAWRIWLQAVELEKTKTDNRESYVDAVTLSIATTICSNLFGLDAAITLVDTYAKRPRSLQHHKQDEDHTEKFVELDVTNVNILLNLSARARSPATSFRIWSAALPRWGVHVDGISLAALLKVARLCELPNRTEQWVDDAPTRFRLLMNEFSFNRFRAPDHSFDAYDDDGFAKGGASVLLDPPGFKWYVHFGNHRPWERCREIFREMLFTNWPHLTEAKSPLDLDAGSFGFLGQLFGSSRLSAPTQKENTLALRLPKSDARYMHVIPKAHTFHAFISLLGLLSRVDEIPITLAWMKELGVRPSWNCMTAAMMFVGEVEGPRRWIQGWGKDGSYQLVRDEEILRRWLMEWLDAEPESELAETGPEADAEGEGETEKKSVVPQEDDVIARRRYIMKRGWKLIL